MNRRRTLLVLAIGSLLIAGVGCKPDPDQFRHFVIAPKADDSGECWIFPDEVTAPPGVKWITVSNYSPDNPANQNTVKVEISGQFAKIPTPTATVFLDPGQTMLIELKPGLPSGSVYPFQVTGPTGTCLSGLPNPRIVIP